LIEGPNLRNVYEQYTTQGFLTFDNSVFYVGL